MSNQHSRDFLVSDRIRRELFNKPVPLQAYL
jgi:hypothetical protein